jgi:hypothetical protein
MLSVMVRALSSTLALTFWFFASLPCTAASSAPRSQPTEVKVGLYMVDIYDLSIKEESFVADFYLWLTWKGNLNPENFEFMNGELQAKDNPQTIKKDGLNYICWRCRGKFRSPLDFRNYPKDQQILRLEIEDSFHDQDELIYTFEENSRLEPYPISIHGFRMSQPQRYEITTHEYKTNYGNPFRAPDENTKYSRVGIIIPIEHTGTSLTFIKLFLPVFLSVLIALLTFLIEPIDLDPRFGVGVAAIFGAVSSMLVANSSIPETSYFSLSDQIHLISLLFIFISIFVSCIVLKVYKAKGKKVAGKIDLFAGSVLLASYLVFTTIIFLGS